MVKSRYPRHRGKTYRRKRKKSQGKGGSVSERQFYKNQDSGNDRHGEKSDFHQKQMEDKARFHRAVETDFWFTICFLSDWQKMTFLVETGWVNLYGRWQDGRFVNHPDAKKPAAYPLTSKRRVRTRPPIGTRQHGADAYVPNPLEGMEVIEGDIEAVALMELRQLRDAASVYEREPMPEYWEPVKSPHYVPVVFQCIEHKEQFLKQVGWRHLGDRYLDGIEMNKLFKLPKLPDVAYPVPPPSGQHDYINGYWLAQVHGIEIEHIYLANKKIYKDKDWQRLSFMEE